YIVYGTIFYFSSSLRDLELNRYYYIQGYLFSLMPILAFYGFFQKKFFNKQKIYFYIIPFFILALLLFVKNYNDVILRVQDEGRDLEEITNNIGYNFLLLFPLILLIKNKIFRYILLLISFGFIISSFKRGAIIIGTISLIYIIWYDLIHSRGKNKLLTILILLAVSLIGYKYIANLYSSSDYFQYRVEKTEEGSMSNRDIIWAEIWESYLNGNPIQLLLGQGANSTLETSDKFAHNDWLETLHNNGFIGTILLLSFYLSILRTGTRLKYYITPEEFLSFRVLFIICFVRTFFSMSIMDMELSITLILGYLIYLRKRNLTNSNLVLNDDKTSVTAD
ncbi:MAG: O-antigen ligase family protein, partial [Muribaculaceae bacterium]|nr:O-antigen ligase family protein [Muribaculaceae bacterium]